MFEAAPSASGTRAPPAELRRLVENDTANFASAARALAVILRHALEELGRLAWRCRAQQLVSEILSPGKLQLANLPRGSLDVVPVLRSETSGPSNVQ